MIGDQEKVLSKVDLMKKWGRPPKGFYYYFEGTEVSDYFEFDELEEENEKNEKNIERQEYVM
jgi:hypothetical protein